MGYIPSVFGAAIALVLAAAGEKVEIKVIDQIVGQDSLRMTPGVELARNQNAWSRLWSAHRGADASSSILVRPDSAAPELDFSKVMVLALFDGESPRATEFRVWGTKDLGDRAVVRLAAQNLDRSSLRIQTRSFGIFMLTRYRKPLEVEIERDGKWVVIAKFPAAP